MNAIIVKTVCRRNDNDKIPSTKELEKYYCQSMTVFWNSDRNSIHIRNKKHLLFPFATKQNLEDSHEHTDKSSGVSVIKIETIAARKQLKYKQKLVLNGMKWNERNERFYERFRVNICFFRRDSVSVPPRSGLVHLSLFTENYKMYRLHC